MTRPFLVLHDIQKLVSSLHCSRAQRKRSKTAASTSRLPASSIVKQFGLSGALLKSFLFICLHIYLAYNIVYQQSHLDWWSLNKGLGFGVIITYVIPGGGGGPYYIYICTVIDAPKPPTLYRCSACLSSTLTTREGETP